MTGDAQAEKFRIRILPIVIFVCCVEVDEVGNATARNHDLMLFHTAMLTLPAGAFLAGLGQLWPVGRVDLRRVPSMAVSPL